MRTITKLFVLIALTIFTQGLEAQPWIENVKSENPTFQDIQKSFYDYWKDKTIEKGTGYKQFKLELFITSSFFNGLVFPIIIK